MTEITLLDEMLLEIGDMPHGLDFGGWTVWDPEMVKEEYKDLIDFVIWGIGWGALPHPHYDYMVPIIKKLLRKMIYPFFNRAPAWEKQADFILRTIDLVEPRAVFIDWERTNHLPNKGYGVDETERLGNQASKAWRIIEKVQANFDGPVGLYSNFYDYMIFQRYGYPLHELPFWATFPDDIPFGTPGTDQFWRWVDRPKGDYLIDQYSWNGHGPDWGTTNGKMKMDLNVFPGGMKELDKFLGIKDGPPSPRRARPPFRIKPR